MFSVGYFHVFYVFSDTPETMVSRNGIFAYLTLVLLYQLFGKWWFRLIEKKMILGEFIYDCMEKLSKTKWLLKCEQKITVYISLKSYEM